MKEIIKELSYEERAVWGQCPTCKAEHGKKYDPNIGMPLGRDVKGNPPEDGVHLSRLNQAP